MSSRHPLAGRAITRMNGAGNKILVLDLRGSPPFAPAPADARAIHRAPGLDYDQMMVLERSPHAREPPPMCRSSTTTAPSPAPAATATRCVADRLSRESGVDALEDRDGGAASSPASALGRGPIGSTWGRRGSAGSDIPLARAVEDTRRVDLWPEGGGPAALGPAAVVNMGNPHAVFFVPDLARVDAGALGAAMEVHPMFPEKANVTFAEIIARDEVTARVWERGVGLTLACGSAACATLVAASRLGLDGAQGNGAPAGRRAHRSSGAPPTTMC